MGHQFHNLCYGQWVYRSTLFAPTEHLIHACSQVMSSEGHCCWHWRSSGTFSGLICVWTSVLATNYTYICPINSSMRREEECVVCHLCSDARLTKIWCIKAIFDYSLRADIRPVWSILNCDARVVLGSRHGWVSHMVTVERCGWRGRGV